MRRMQFGVLVVAVLAGTVGAVFVNRLKLDRQLPNTFVSADGESTIELPCDPTPCEAADASCPTLLPPEHIAQRPNDDPADVILVKSDPPADGTPELLPMPDLVPQQLEPAEQESAVAPPTPSTGCEEPFPSAVIATPQAAPVAAPPEAPIKPHAARQPLPLPETVLSAPKKTESAAELLPATGTFTCTLNQQVELTLPTAAHEQLDKPRVLFVALAPDKKCLWLYTKSGVEALADRLDHLGADDEAARCTQRMCYSRLHRVQPNAAGAFLLPVELVEIACLKNNVILIGVRDHFELWDAEAWEQYIGGAVDAAWPFPLGHERMEDGGLFVGSMIILQPSDPKKDGHDDSKDSGPHNESMQSGTFGTETPPHQVIDRVHGGITPGQGNLVPGQ